MKLDAYPIWIKSKVAGYNVDWVIFELAPQTLQMDPLIRLTRTKIGALFSPVTTLLENVLPDRGTYNEYYAELKNYLTKEGVSRKKLLMNVKSSCDSIGARCAAIVWPLMIKRRINLFAAVDDIYIELLHEAGIPAISVWDRYKAHPLSKLVSSPFDPHPSALADRLVAQAIADFLIQNDLINRHD